MGKKRRSTILFILIFASIFSSNLRIRPVLAATITVPTDYPTIQGAINMAYAGDTIRVLAGTYAETLIVNNRVKIIGENKTSTIIDGGGLGNVILITVSSVSISGFTIRNSAAGWPHSGILVDKASSSNISNNIIENNDHGILLNRTQNSYIGNNYLADNWAAIELYNSVKGNKITNNNVTNNEFGIWVFNSPSNTLSNNNAAQNKYGLWLFDSTNNSLRNNHMTLNQYSFGVWGSDITHYINDINASNFVNNKPLYYWINRHQADVPSDPGYVALVNSTQITVRNSTLRNNGQGILLAYTSNSSIINNNLINNRVGVELFSSSNNIITNNNATDGLYGFMQSESSSNLLSNNKAANNQYGIKLYNSNSNIIKTNSFANNTLQAISSESTNIWDNGYPSGGNYWSDYAGVDMKNGPNQDKSGSDGIGDSPYVINANNTDRYPLLDPVAVHDIAVNLTAPRTIVAQGYDLLISVQAVNKGNRIETVNITVSANTTVIMTQIANLTIGTTIITFAWNTSAIVKAYYIISAKALPVLGETNTTDNNFQYGGVIITVPGDTDGDRSIDIYDIVRLAWVYSTKRGEARFNPNCDIDGNDVVNIYDVVIATSRYGYKES